MPLNTPAALARDTLGTLVSLPGRAAASPDRPAVEDSVSPRTATWPAATARVVAPVGAVRAEVLDRASALSAGIDGMLFRLSRTDAGVGDVAVGIDYSSFAGAYGANYAQRLRLMRFPACVLTRPADASCGTGVPVPSRNDLVGRRVVADAVAVDSSAVFALLAGADSQTGSFKPTSLSPSSTWAVGLQSGSFTYSVPIALPPPPAGAGPSLALGYDSGSVDGRTAATNNQASPAGLGWDLSMGFVERRFKPCADDGHPTWGDLCWQSPTQGGDDNGSVLHLSLNGHATRIIQDNNGTDGSPYFLEDDPGWKLEHFGGPQYGDSHEYWVVSTGDGTQYWFGLGKEPTSNLDTNSDWTVPVVGDDDGEPGISSYPDPKDQNYRWNLDRIVDPNENVTTLFYATETNRYRRYHDGVVKSYVSGGYLKKIEYGQRDGAENVEAPAYADIRTTDRCTQRTTEPNPMDNTPAACPALSEANASSYPDVPVDLICSAAPCTGKYAPVFFNRERYDDILTYVQQADGSGHDLVFQYQFKFAFPAPGDGTDPALWLDYIQRRGYAPGTEQTAPPINFDGTNLANRVDYSTALGVPPTNFRRVTTIYTELGAKITVDYGHQDACSASSLPSPATNTEDCYPVYFKPEGAPAGWGWFHKYLVRSVTVSPRVGQGPGGDGAPDMTTSYDYYLGAAWHHDRDPLFDDSDGRESWSQWRGYERVEVQQGSGATAQRTRYRYFRGMDGDKTASGGTKTAVVGDSFGNTRTDEHWLRGRTREVSKLNPSTGNTYDATLSDYWAQIKATYAGQPASRQVRENVRTTRTRVVDSWAYRDRTVSTTFDSFGMPRQVSDTGDPALDDERCTEYDYARNTDAMPVGPDRWLVEYVQETRVFDDDCPSGTKALVSKSQAMYDGVTSVTANRPIDGNPTESRAYTAASAYLRSTRTFDELGRITSETSPRGFVTSTVYSPATGYPRNGVTVTNPAGHTATVQTWWAWGVPTGTTDANGKVTTLSYDPLSRLTRVIRPGDIGPFASYKFMYDMTYDATTPVSSAPRITADQLAQIVGTNPVTGVYLTSAQYLDGLGRLRETQRQAPASPSTRMVEVTRYDNAGRTVSSSAPMYSGSAVGSGLLNPALTAIPSYTVSGYDFLGQETSTALFALGVQKWATTTTFNGSWRRVDPPIGGDTVQHSDAYGHVTKVEEFDGTAHYDATYGYTDRDELSRITDARGNTMTFLFDWLGRRLSSVDPDQGSWLYGYDADSNPTSVTDALNATVVTRYDELDRPIERRQGSVSGTLLASWLYDPTGAKGQLASSSSHVDGAVYTTAVTGYDNRYRPTGHTITIPASVGALAGTYAYGYTYDSADRVTSTTYPAAGGLPAETVTTTWNSSGFPTRLTGLATYVDSTTFTGSGLLDERVVGTGPNQLVRDLVFDESTRRLTANRTLRGGAAIQHDAYVYDAVGNVTSLTDQVFGQAECFQHDQRNRMSRAWTQTPGTCSTAGAGGGSTGYHDIYTYHPDGNIVSIQTVASPFGPDTRTYGYPAPGAGSVRPHAVATITRAGGTDTYGYNANGALNTRSIVGGAATTFTWNAEHQLSSATSAGQTTRFIYTADGSRLLREEPLAKTLYLPGMELREPLFQAVTATRYYTDGTGATVAMRTPAGLTWLTADYRGTMQVAVDNASGTVKRQRYGPWGTPRGSMNELPTERGYLGKTEDDTTGLIHLGARYYDPKLARFISTDPLMMPAAPQTVNPYTYSLNNPVTYSDPTGLRTPCPDDCDWGGHNRGGVLPPADEPDPSPPSSPPGNRPRDPCVLYPWICIPPSGSGDDAGDQRPWFMSQTGVCGLSTLSGPVLGTGCDTLAKGGVGQKGKELTDEQKAAIIAAFLALLAVTWSPDDPDSPNVLFRAADSGGPSTFTPRLGNDTDGYPLNGLSAYTTARRAITEAEKGRGGREVKRAFGLSVGLLLKIPGVRLVRDPGDSEHYFVQGATAGSHREWAASRETGFNHPFTRGVMDAKIPFADIPRWMGLFL